MKYNSILTKIFSLMLLTSCLLGYSKIATAQTTATIGTGTSNTLGAPIYSYFNYSYCQMLYTASEVSSAGGSSSMLITKLRFYFTSGAATNSDNWTVYLGNTSKTAFSTTSDWVSIGSLTNVFSGTVSYPVADNWLEIPLSTPFSWDGTSNLVIAVDENASGYFGYNYWRFTSSSANSVILYYSDYTNPSPSSPPTASTRNSNRPNVQLVFENPCSGTPTAGSSSASPSSVCLGGTTTLSVTSATVGAGIWYQWQSSPDNSTWSDISGATSATYKATPSAPTYYRRKITCSYSTLSSYSTSTLVSFTYSVTSTTGASRCGVGTASIAATGTSSIKWYKKPSGGAPLGSGSPYTTPTLYATDTFYASAETNSSGTGVLVSGSTFENFTDGETPFAYLFPTSHSQYLIRASDLSASGFGAGYLTALSFNVSTKYTYMSSLYTMKLGLTTASDLSSGMLSPTFTTVYGPSYYTTSTGTNNFTFPGAGFYWDGSSNIVVDICADNTSTGDWVDDDGVTFVNMPYTATRGVYDYTASTCGVSTGTYGESYGNYMPQITFTGNKVCGSPRIPVTVNVSTPPAFAITGTNTICNNTVTSLSVTSTLSNYTSYTWSPATNLYTNAACTVPYTTGSSYSTVYYKNATAAQTKYTCTAYNSSSTCANQDTAWITNLPSSANVVATPAFLCMSGSATLALTPSSGYGAAQYQWQSSPNNSTWTDSTSMTTNTLTTNTLSNTRYYRLAIKNSSGGVCFYSNSDTAKVLKPSFDSVKNGVRCGPGSVALRVYPKDGSVTWFASSSSTTPLDTGNLYNTPSISTTTTYYAEVKGSPDAEYSIGSGTSVLYNTGLIPFSNWYESAHTQYLILASDLSAAGLTAGDLSGITFDIAYKYSYNAFDNYTMKLANTSLTSLSYIETGASFTNVYGPASYTTSTGLNTLPFDAPFTWDGTSNILVDLCFDNSATSGYSDDDYVYCTSKSYTASFGFYYDGMDMCPEGDYYYYYYYDYSNYLPNIKFQKKGCTPNTRTAVVATVNSLPIPTITPSTSPINICDGQTKTFTAGGGGTYQWSTSSGPITGASSSTFTTGTSGSYRVVVTNTSNGCKDSTSLVTLNVNPLPTVSISPKPTTAVCADSSQLFTSVSTGAALTFKWLRSDTAIIGAVKDTFRTDTPGVYSLAVFSGSCSDTSEKTTLTVNPLPSSSFGISSANIAICLDGTIELQALSIPTTSAYQWLRNDSVLLGATSRKLITNIPGIYSVKITDKNNCRKISDTLGIFYSKMGYPDITPREAVTCEGNIIKIIANTGPYGLFYKWYKNGTLLPADTFKSFDANSPGLYSVTVTDIYGCTLPSPNSTLTIMPLPTKPVITKSGSVLSTTMPYTTYQWYRNTKKIAGATLRNYKAMFDGRYSVVVTNAANCFNSSDTLIVQLQQSNSINTQVISKVEVGLFPNPTQDKINITSPIPVNVIVNDALGKMVLTMDNATEVDMSKFADAVYMFTITDKEGNILRRDRIIKKSN